MQIESKRKFFRLWREGMLGNRTQLWDDPFVAFNAGCAEYGFREHGKLGGGAWERVPQSQFWQTYHRWKEAKRVFSMDDVVPDEAQTIQGEVCRTYRGLEGYIGASHLPMRKAAAAGLLTHRSPCATFVILNTYMDPPSRDDLDALLELYPDAAIEFTCFTRQVGWLRRNTMFWEVRNY